MLDQGHPAFSPPESDCTLWRYMNLAKLLALLDTRQLYFSRSDLFDDPYEGATSRATLAQLERELIAEGLQGAKVKEAVLAFLAGTEAHRRSIYLSCWFASEHESAAMWKIYCASDEGVAIKVRHSALLARLETSALRIRTSRISYVDYDQVIIPRGNGFFPCVHKRLSFAHESEVRAVIWSREDVNQSQIASGVAGVHVHIDPAKLIEAVHVSPTAPAWFGELVQRVLGRYAPGVQVVRSNLYDRPTY